MDMWSTFVLEPHVRAQVKSAGRVIATSWFMTFTTVIVFVMFNMLLAIIFGTYDEVRANIGPGAETLWSQTIEITSRM